MSETTPDTDETQTPIPAPRPPRKGAVATLRDIVQGLPGGGEIRSGQEKMTTAVESAIDSGASLAAIAGTGTGKSLAYLLPAILSGKKTVVATATKALQDQLAAKDLPFLQEHLDMDFKWSILKGRSNYACLQAVEEEEEERSGRTGRLQLDEEKPKLDEEVEKLIIWAYESQTGDQGELTFEPSPQAWSKVSVGQGECPGASSCPKGDVCFAEKARGEATVADVVIVNQHLYGFHARTQGRLLPDHDILIFDEAHELESGMTGALGLEISPWNIRGVAISVRKSLVGKGIDKGLQDAADNLETVLAGLSGDRVKGGPSADVALSNALEKGRRECDKLLGRAKRAAEGAKSGGGKAKAARMLQALSSLADTLDAALISDDNQVTWVEPRGESYVLKIAPIDIASAMRRMVWPNVEVGIVASATLPKDAPKRLGMDNAFTIEAESPFDYRERAVLYVPVGLPEPRDAKYPTESVKEIEKLVTAAGGRSLILFTSYASMNTAANALRGKLPFPVHVQGELPKGLLIKKFSEEHDSCLFATTSFWQGVDVQGASLSLVIIDKLPFPRPDDPVIQARREKYAGKDDKKAGYDAFLNVDVPYAGSLLAQGVGRLIRGINDGGVVAVLDSRLATKSYRSKLLEMVPPLRRSRDRDSTIKFLQEQIARQDKLTEDKAKEAKKK